MKVGASYYPEVLPESEWAKDLKTGKEVGLSVLRCGEFAWSKISPKPDEWNTQWITRFLNLAHDIGYDVVWCTPSATPPPYIFDRWPDLQAVNIDGSRPPVGIRRNYCPCHAGYLDLCAQTAEKLASELSHLPGVMGWQIDNELAGDGFTCWCPICRTSFQSWLQKRYESLDHLNETWENDIWSQRYTSWQQIPIPARPFVDPHTPALRLAYARFRGDTWHNFYLRQSDAIHKANPKAIVTTNIYDATWDMPFDQWKWAKTMDAIGMSHYVEGEFDSRFTLATMRGLAGEGAKKVWVLEQKAGQQAVQNYFPEDLSRLKSHLTRCARSGAEYAVYWHLRQHSAGCESEHGAVLRHDGKATRIAQAVKRAIEETRDIKPVPPKPGVVLLFSFQQQWANDHRRPWATKFDYRMRLAEEWYAAACDLFGEIRISGLNEIGTPPKLLIAPLAQMLEPGLPEAFDACLKSGGAVITTVDFARLDFENNVLRKPPLAALEKWIKIPALEILHLTKDFQAKGNFAGEPVSGSIFWAIPQAETSLTGEALGELEHDQVSGPLALRYSVGSGQLIVAMTEPDRKTAVAIIRSVFPGS